jgi:hypothetical protein
LRSCSHFFEPSLPQAMVPSWASSLLRLWCGNSCE